MRVSLCALIFGFFSIFGLVERSAAEQGYLSDVGNERDSRFYEVFLFAAPPQKEKKLSEVIFNEELSKEFRDKYRERFGQMDTESIIYQPTKFSVFDENRGAVLQLEKNQEQRRQFGEYMTRRLFEWHVDNYFKTDPTMRPVYELKEKLSNVEVQVTKQTKFNLRYNFSDNTADIVCDNAYTSDAKLSLMMDPKAFGPGPVLEQKLIIQKQLDKKLRVNTSATVTDGIASLEFIRALTNNWSTNFVTTAAYKEGGTSPRESHYLVGLGHSY